MMVACKEGNYRVVQKLFEKGASVSETDMVRRSGILFFSDFVTILYFSWKRELHVNVYLARDDTSSLCRVVRLRTHSQISSITTKGFSFNDKRKFLHVQLFGKYFKSSFLIVIFPCIWIWNMFGFFGFFSLAVQSVLCSFFVGRRSDSITSCMYSQLTCFCDCEIIIERQWRRSEANNRCCKICFFLAPMIGFWPLKLYTLLHNA